MDDDGTVIPVRESDEVIAHIIATSESLSAGRLLDGVQHDEYPSNDYKS